jgi:hypothetical protein
VKDDVHGAFTPEMMKIPQTIWIETFVDGVIDKSTGLSIFKELAWFVYKVSGVMCSASACEHCWSIEGWLHSKRRNTFHQTSVEKLVVKVSAMVKQRENANAQAASTDSMGNRDEPNRTLCAHV